MSGYEGMDKASVESVVKKLLDAKHQIGQACRGLNSAVGAMEWKGPDASRFKSEWPNQAKQIKQCEDLLDNTARLLKNQIKEQDTASAH